jgi:hypothetical protein
MAELSETERRWRTLMVAAVALAYPLGQTGFQLGAYGELLFQHRLVAWTAVTATFCVFAVLPKAFMPVPRWHMWILAIPSLWMFVRFAIGISASGSLIHPVIYALGIASFVVCFPYAIYLIIRVANPDLTDIRGLRLWSILAAIAGIFFVLGYLIGTWSEYFVSCQEARIGRIETPAYCRRGA